MEITSILNNAAYIISSLIVFFGWGVLYKKHIFSFAENWDEQKVKTLATSIGMLFTFLGIVAGLMSFDTNNLIESIPQLLGGLKTAFLTSIAGIFVSFLATLKEKTSSQEVLARGGGDASIESQILLELQNLNKNIIGEGETSLNTMISKLRQDTIDNFSILNASTKNGFEFLSRNITGDGESSLNTSLMRLRQDNSDNFKSLNTSFDDFAQKMAEQNIDALTEAIEKVMGEFNETINKKLGKTFEDFRESVVLLNSWQSQYKDLLSEYHQKITDIHGGFDKSIASISTIESSFEKISDINVTFEKMTQKLNQRLEEMSGFTLKLDSLANELDGKAETISKELRDMALSAFDLTQKHMNQTNETLESSALDIQKQIASTGQRVSESIEQVNKEMDETVNKTLASFGSNLASISSRMAEDFSRIQQMLQNKN